jgi:pimeloyl-ACP methyl ester carboxylesterase
MRMKPFASQFVDVRGMRHHVMTWGSEGAPLLVMLHGWMDVGASFQFLVDALARDWYVVAPDLRGFGRSEWQPQGYWFWDYVADLDVIVDRYSPRQPVRLVGHSLGGNVVMHYAGSRPERVARVVSLEGFGIPF